MESRSLAEEFFLSPGDILNRDSGNGRPTTELGASFYVMGGKGCQCVSCQNTGCNK